jgi:hypothetical protein
MSLRSIPLLLLVLFAGCSAYKELTPDPPLSPLERGYVELRADDEHFTLERDVKYVIKFPRPLRSQFYLVLVTDKKWAVTAYLTDRFDGDGPFPRIPDQSGGNDTVYVYPVDTTSLSYAWVIDTVRSDVELTMLYRYVPRWRYTFETRYKGFVETLAQNRVDRTTFNAIDRDFNFKSLNFGSESANLDVRGRNLRTLNDELVAMESLFPPDVTSAMDTAYVKYRALRSDVSDEISFQENYRAVLDVFEKEQASQGNTAAFLSSAGEFAGFVKDTKRFPQRILDRARSNFLSRLNEAFPYYDAQLRAKRDATKIDLSPPIQPVIALYAACGTQVPGDLATLSQFVERFNVEAGALASARTTLRRLETLAEKPSSWTSDTLFADLISAAQQAGSSLPQSALSRYPGFVTYPCALQLRSELSAAAAHAAGAQSLYQSARAFLANLNSGSWIVAETILRDMHTGGQFTDVPAVEAQKRALVNHFEGEMFSRILSLSRRRADEFVARNDTTLDNISTLYANLAFTPVYDMTFSAGGQAELTRKKKQVQDYLDQKKYHQLPENAITAIYGALTASVNVRGVEKARAIVEHGKMYRGDTKEVRRMIDECDPATPKWVVRPKEYRRIMALPVNPTRSGQNEYVVRLRLQIPSEAQFPVFDITVKLPREVAENARTTQWYQSITINQTPIKNEGRFRITTPTSENGYESLITPVQMDKEGRNVLEIRFRHPAFRVFEISAMAQVPIIRKN